MKDNQPKIYTVSEINRLAQELLEGQFSNIWIEGEISNFRGASGSGHCYFSIKDANSQVDVVAFKGVMSYLRFQMGDGLKILVFGRVSLYTQRGRFQIIAEKIEPKGLGALQIAFEQLKKKLEAEGLFDPARKKPIPAFPQRIGIVTSPTGAAVKDILSIIDRRFANVEIIIYPVKVQGDGAKEEIAEAINYLNNNYPDIDVMLVGRGGGSIEDLWAFNEEIVARAIAASKIPVISCVGHEIDFTIADFVADLRAPTPSAAAELVVKNKADLEKTIDDLRSRLVQGIQGELEFLSEKLNGTARSAVFSKPQRIFESQLQTLDYMLEKMRAAFDKCYVAQENRAGMLGSKIRLLSPEQVLNEKGKLLDLKLERFSGIAAHRLGKMGDTLKNFAGRLEALSPLAVLSRGYAIAWALPGNVLLKSYDQVSARDRVKIRLGSGEIEASVEKTFKPIETAH